MHNHWLSSMSFPIDIRTATYEQLLTLPKVGEARAAQILREREVNPELTLDVLADRVKLGDHWRWLLDSGVICFGKDDSTPNASTVVSGSPTSGTGVPVGPDRDTEDGKPQSSDAGGATEDVTVNTDVQGAVGGHDEKSMSELPSKDSMNIPVIGPSLSTDTKIASSFLRYRDSVVEVPSEAAESSSDDNLSTGSSHKSRNKKLEARLLRRANDTEEYVLRHRADIENIIHGVQGRQQQQFQELDRKLESSRQEMKHVQGTLERVSEQLAELSLYRSRSGTPSSTRSRRSKRSIRSPELPSARSQREDLERYIDECASRLQTGSHAGTALASDVPVGPHMEGVAEEQHEEEEQCDEIYPEDLQLDKSVPPVQPSQEAVFGNILNSLPPDRIYRPLPQGTEEEWVNFQKYLRASEPPNSVVPAGVVQKLQWADRDLEQDTEGVDNASEGTHEGSVEMNWDPMGMSLRDNLRTSVSDAAVPPRTSQVRMAGGPTPVLDQATTGKHTPTEGPPPSACGMTPLAPPVKVAPLSQDRPRVSHQHVRGHEASVRTQSFPKVPASSSNRLLASTSHGPQGNLNNSLHVYSGARPAATDTRRLAPSHVYTQMATTEGRCEMQPVSTKKDLGRRVVVNTGPLTSTAVKTERRSLAPGQSFMQPKSSEILGSVVKEPKVRYMAAPRPVHPPPQSSHRLPPQASRPVIRTQATVGPPPQHVYFDKGEPMMPAPDPPDLHFAKSEPMMPASEPPDHAVHYAGAPVTPVVCHGLPPLEGWVYHSQGGSTGRQTTTLYPYPSVPPETTADSSRPTDQTHGMAESSHPMTPVGLSRANPRMSMADGTYSIPNRRTQQELPQHPKPWRDSSTAGPPLADVTSVKGGTVKADDHSTASRPPPEKRENWSQSSAPKRSWSQSTPKNEHLSYQAPQPAFESDDDYDDQAAGSRGNRRHANRRGPELPRPRLPDFNGVDGKYESFIYQFEGMANRYHWSDADRLDQFKACLSGKAVDHIMALPEGITNNYNLLKRQFKKRFGAPDRPDVIRGEIYDIRQRADEGLEDFADRVQKAAAIAYEGIDEANGNKFATEAFLKGVRDSNAKRDAARLRPTTVADALVAVKEEAVLNKLIGRSSAVRGRHVMFQEDEVGVRHMSTGPVSPLPRHSARTASVAIQCSPRDLSPRFTRIRSGQFMAKCPDLKKFAVSRGRQ